jgi:hypothetical protein
VHLINYGFEIMQVINKNKILSNLFKIFVDSQPPMDKDFSIMKNLEKKSLNEIFLSHE